MRLIYLTNETAWDVIKCQTEQKNEWTNERALIFPKTYKHTHMILFESNVMAQRTEKEEKWYR